MPEVSPEMQELMDETLAAVKRGEMQPEKVEWWWEGRREYELTPVYLGRVLDELPAADLAKRARAGHFDDFHAPADVADGFELIRFVVELRQLAKDWPELAERIAAIENAVRRGEFDATLPESDRWAASKDGQETFAQLVRSRPKAAGRNEPCPCGSGVKYKRCCGA